ERSERPAPRQPPDLHGNPPSPAASVPEPNQRRRSCSLVLRTDGGRRSAMGKGGTGAAAGGGAIYGLGIFGALFYYWQQANSFWEYVWAIFPKAVFWQAYMVYEGF